MRIHSCRRTKRLFKLVEGKDGSTTFMPIESTTGGKVNYVQDKETKCLTESQANYIYKKVETGQIIKTVTIKPEIEQEALTQSDRNNPYEGAILNKRHTSECESTPMENWSIVSNNIKYVMHNDKKVIIPNLDYQTLDYQQNKDLYCRLNREKANIM